MLQSAVEAAFADGLSLVEVEFPPLQQDYLEDSGSSAYDVSSANVRLATRFAQSFAAEGKVRRSKATPPVLFYMPKCLWLPLFVLRRSIHGCRDQCGLKYFIAMVCHPAWLLMPL